MQIHCRYCASEIKAEDVNLDKLLAKCANCNAVFSIAGELGLAEGEKPTKRKQMESVPLPRYVTLNETPSELTITRKWFTERQTSLVVFAVIWNSFMLFWFAMAIREGAWQMAACGSIHAAVGLFLIYVVATNFVNATLITVNAEHLDIKHGPIPAWGEKTLTAVDVAQLFCKQMVQRSKNSTTITYEVHAIMNDQRYEKLLDNLYHPEQALYIEQEIERFLGVENRDVPGELRKY